MIIRKFTRIILGAALGISVFAFAGNVPETAYAANMSDISVTSTSPRHLQCSSCIRVDVHRTQPPVQGPD